MLVFFLNVVRLNCSGDGYRMLKNNMMVYVYLSSVVRGIDLLLRVIIYYELVVMSKEFVRSVIFIDFKWFIEFGGYYYDKKDVEVMEGKKVLK